MRSTVGSPSPDAGSESYCGIVTQDKRHLRVEIREIAQNAPWLVGNRAREGVQSPAHV